MELKKWMACVAMALPLASGCASSSGSAVKAAAAYMAPIDGLALAAGAAIAWKLTTMPSWSVEAILRGDLWQIDLERSMFTGNGAGGGSFAFAQAAKELCQKQGAPRYQTQSFIEYREPMILGERQRARGQIRCQAERVQEEW